MNMELSRHDIGTCRGDMVAELSGAAATEELTTVRGPVRQRRLWSCTDKRALVDLASAAGSSVTEVAEAFGVAPSHGRRRAGCRSGDSDLPAHRRERSARGRTLRRRLPGRGRQDRRWPFRAARDCGLMGPSIRQRCVSSWRSRPGDHGGADRPDLPLLRHNRYASRDQQPGTHGDPSTAAGPAIKSSRRRHQLRPLQAASSAMPRSPIS